MPPGGLQLTLRVGCQTNATALTRMVGQFGVGAKAGATVFRLVAVNRCTLVLVRRAFGRLVALVHPQRVQHALCIKRHRFKTVGDLLPVLVHRESCAEALPAIAAAQHANEARVRPGKRHGVTDHHPVVGAKGDLGSAFAIGRNGVVAGIQDACFAPLHSAAQRRALHEQLRLRIQPHHPQTPIRRDGRSGGQLRALVASVRGGLGSGHFLGDGLRQKPHNGHHHAKDCAPGVPSGRVVHKVLQEIEFISKGNGLAKPPNPSAQ